jgi:hypothetical protein
VVTGRTRPFSLKTTPAIADHAFMPSRRCERGRFYQGFFNIDREGPFYYISNSTIRPLYPIGSTKILGGKDELSKESLEKELPMVIWITGRPGSGYEDPIPEEHPWMIHRPNLPKGLLRRITGRAPKKKAFSIDQSQMIETLS